MQRLVEKTRCSLDKKWVRASAPSKEAAVAKSKYRRPGDNRPMFEIEHWGWIYIDHKYERFEAVCGCLGEELTPYQVPAPWCKVRDHRTHNGPCKMQRVGAKQPLGLLVAWLRDGCLWESHEAHLEGTTAIERVQRLEARAWLQGQPDMAALLKQEKAWDKHKLAAFDAAGNIEEPMEIK